MEFAAAAIASIGSAIGGGAAASGAAAGAAGTAAAAGAAGTAAAAGSAAAGSSILSTLATASTWATILSGGATVLSLMSQRRGSEMDAMAIEQQAADAQSQIGQERITGESRRNSIRRALLESIGDRDTAYAASGVDLSFGTPAMAREQAAKSAERALGQDQDSEDFNVSRLQQRAQNLRMRAQATRRSGALQATATGLSAGAQILRRG